MEPATVQLNLLANKSAKGKAWKMEVREGRGRCLVAARQLEVGEVVLEEKPTVFGPKQISVPCCLGCYKRLDFHQVRWCEKCALPLCSSTCKLLDNHRPECEMLAPARERIILNSEKDLQQVYYFVTVLRALWLRGRQEDQWAAINQLMSNLEYRIGTKVFFFNQTYVVDTLNHFGILDFSDDEIQRVCGIFDSNAFESSAPYRAPCRGLYIAASLLNSSCLPNTRHYFKKTGEMVVVTTRPVYPGGELLSCYTQTRWATKPRQKHLINTKYFRCCCARCEALDECSAYSSALLCQKPKCAGPVLPPKLGDSNCDWACQKCATKMPHRKVVTCEAVSSQLVHARDVKDPNYLTTAITKLSSWLYPLHYTITELKMSAALEWGDPAYVTYKELTASQMQLKLKMCEDLLARVELLEGEKSRSKAFLVHSILQTIKMNNNKMDGLSEELTKKLTSLKKEMLEIFNGDCGAPSDYSTL